MGMEWEWKVREGKGREVIKIDDIRTCRDFLRREEYGKGAWYYLERDGWMERRDVHCLVDLMRMKGDSWCACAGYCFYDFQGWN